MGTVMAAAASGSAGCGWGSLQTARPTPKGALDMTLGAGLVHNETVQRRRDIGESAYAVTNFPHMFNARLGLTDRLDVGLKLFHLAGLQLDTKINLLSPTSRFALSVRAGFGGARDLWTKKGAGLVNLPVALHASYDFPCGLTPYVSAGYSMYWIFGRDKEDTDQVDYVDREGTGDHLVTVNAGLQYRFTKIFAMQVEYNYWAPVVDDPGDFFSFVQNHIVLVGFTWRAQIFNRHRAAPPPPRDPRPQTRPTPGPGALPTPPPDETPGAVPPPPPPPAREYEPPPPP
jgi:opacity protein-like surface antigen